MLPKEGEAEYMRNVVNLEKEEFKKNFICPAEQMWLEQGATTAAKKIAQKMLNKKGMSLREIAKLTGVSIIELKKLKEKKH